MIQGGMSPSDLSAVDLTALVGYLESLSPATVR